MGYFHFMVQKYLSVYKIKDFYFQNVNIFTVIKVKINNNVSDKLIFLREK